MAKRPYSKHGMTNTPEYQAWRNMKERCTNMRSPEYHLYGGRGISIVLSWFNSFDAFLADVGRRPSPTHSIDRIDTDGNYEPGNVRWATRIEQQQNLRTNVNLTLNGETHCVREWSRRTGIAKNTILERKRRGWSDTDILTVAPQAKGYKHRVKRANPTAPEGALSGL